MRMIIALVFLLVSFVNLNAAETYTLDAESLKKAEQSIKKGAEYLLTKQNADGSFGKALNPASTCLSIVAIYNAPGIDKKKLAKAISSGLKYILQYVQKDGAIFPSAEDQTKTQNYPNYTTAVALITLATVNRPEDLIIMRKARKFLQGSQFNNKNSVDFGGIGYGRTGRADMSNLSFSSEALHFTEYLDKEPFTKDPEAAKKTKLMWKNMQQFISRCQNLRSIHHDSDDISSGPRDKGGFFYRPNESKAGPDGSTIKLISTASMSYAGLKSMMYAKMSKDDVRVMAVMKYLSSNYNMRENPGMGLQGHFYYLHVMTKALDVYGINYLKDSKGVKREWRKDMINQFSSMQNEQGYWSNTNGRFFESMHELASSYAIISLKIAMGKADLKYK
jgi:squalene-hopene/tetraprenyl-beta-curcumene cyclase